MKRPLACKCIVLTVALIFILPGCGQVQSLFGWERDVPGSRDLTVMTYNVQNLFNAIYDGDEYPEYDPRRGCWDFAGYHQRLARLRDVLLRESDDGPDVVLFQEIEHEGILDDLVNGYLRGKGYDFRAATLVDGSAIEVGIISKIPITDIRFHHGQAGDARSPRPVMESVLKAPWGTLHLFNSHWKSKIGGAQQTELRRIASSLVIRSRIAEIRRRDQDSYIIIAGDLNETPWEPREYETALRIYEAGGYREFPRSLQLTGDHEHADAAKKTFYSPWLKDGGMNMEGSYLYRGVWEAIDHLMFCENFFSGSGLEYVSSYVMTDGLLGDDGGPDAWSLHIRRGYSDHLPVIMYGKVIQQH